MTDNTLDTLDTLNPDNLFLVRVTEPRGLLYNIKTVTIAFEAPDAATDPAARETFLRIFMAEKSSPESLSARLRQANMYGPTNYIQVTNGQKVLHPAIQEEREEEIELGYATRGNWDNSGPCGYATIIVTREGEVKRLFRRHGNGCRFEAQADARERARVREALAANSALLERDPLPGELEAAVRALPFVQGLPLVAPPAPGQ